MPSTLKAIMFDVDGTLAETERDGHRVAFNRAFSERGLDWYWSENLYKELLKITGGKERIAHFTHYYRPEEPSLSPADIKRLHSLKTELYRELIANQGIELRTGVQRLITSLHQSPIKMAIATTTSRENVDALFSNTLGEDALAWFDCIACGDIVAAKKPAPDIYQYCLQKLELEPAECLAIEDSYNGLQSAISAGISTVVTCNDYTCSEDFSAALTVVDCLGEPEFPLEVIQGFSFCDDYIQESTLAYLHQQSL